MTRQRDDHLKSPMLRAIELARSKRPNPATVALQRRPRHENAPHRAARFIKIERGESA